MFILIYLGVIIVSYIVTFKTDFSDEHINKAGPFILIISIALVVLGILGSIVS